MTDPSVSLPSLRLDVHRTTQPGYMRESALDGERGFAACVRLENAVFQPLGSAEIICAGAVRISFPNPRTLRIASCQVARRVAHGVPLAVFGATSVRLRDLGVLAEENAIALVGEITHSRLPGEWSLSLRGLAEVCHLTPTAVTRPFAFPLPRRAPAEPAAANPIVVPSTTAHRPANPRPSARLLPARSAHARASAPAVPNRQPRD
jgi:hypothetical protein